MNKLEKVLYYANKQTGRATPYVWSGQGQKLKKFTALDLAFFENSAENAGRVMQYIYKHRQEFNKDTKIFDCSGFVICCLQYAGILPTDYDNTADGLMKSSYFQHVNFCNRKVGDLVFKVEHEKAYHVGLITAEGIVSEAKGRDVGVVANRLDSVWTICRRPFYN